MVVGGFIACSEAILERRAEVADLGTKVAELEALSEVEFIGERPAEPGELGLMSEESVAMGE